MVWAWVVVGQLVLVVGALAFAKVALEVTSKVDCPLQQPLATSILRL